MHGRLHRLVGVSLVAVLAGVATPSASQTGPNLPSDPAGRTPPERVSGTFELLEAVATDGRADPLFGALDGRSGVRALVRYRCPLTFRDLSADSSSSGAPLPEPGSAAQIRAVRISWAELERMRDDPCLLRAEPARLPGSLRPLEITTRATGAAAAHLRPEGGATGSGQTIALLDSPVDILHPAFFLPDGGRYGWLDVDDDGVFTPGRDAVDLDSDGTANSNETLRLLDVDVGFPGGKNGKFEPQQEWLYVDKNGDRVRNAGPAAGFTELDPGYAEDTFVADDVDRDGELEPREFLYRLKTSKIRRMVRGDRTYVRGEDLIEAAADLERPAPHGTAVAGVLVGGPLGFHGRVGVAPRAELLVYGHSRTFEPGSRDNQDRHLASLRDAAERGADVFVSQWTNPFARPLDGSTNLERAMEMARDDGLLQVVPVGNLNRSEKHREAMLSPGEVSNLEFRVPSRITVDGRDVRVRSVFGSLQWRSSPNLEIRLQPPDGPERRLDPAETPIEFSGFDAQIAESETSRNTHVLTFYIRGDDAGGQRSPLPAGRWTFSAHGADASETLYGRVTDTHTGWNRGVGWVEPTPNHATLSFPATADAALGVAAYTGRSSTGSPGRDTGDLQAFSGRGPRIGGERSVDIAAPDNAFVPAASESFAGSPSYDRWFRQFGGTSSAAPHVGGALALLREQNPGTPVGDLETRLLEAAETDGLEPPPGSLPNAAWGHGRLDVHRAMYGEPPPSANRRPEATLRVRITAESAFFDASKSRDPDGDPLQFRFDYDHDGRWDGPWRDSPEATRSRSDTSAQRPIVGRVEVRDPHGARSGALAVARTNEGDVATADGGDASSGGDSDGRNRPPRICHTNPSGPAAPFGAGLLVLASLLVWRRRGGSA